MFPPKKLATNIVANHPNQYNPGLFFSWQLFGFLCLCLLNLLQFLCPFRRSCRFGPVLLHLGMDCFFINDILLNDELLCNAYHVGEEVVKRKGGSHLIEYTYQQEREYIRHPFHHRVVRILHSHITVVQCQE